MLQRSLSERGSNAANPVGYCPAVSPICGGDDECRPSRRRGSPVRLRIGSDCGYRAGGAVVTHNHDTPAAMGIATFGQFSIASPGLAPDQVAYCRELADARREEWAVHAVAALPRTLIAFTGLAGAGKSTAAQHLVARGFTRIRFAGPLKAMMAALGLTHEQIDGTEKETPCALLGGKTPRYAMQTIGTEWGRDLIANDLWIRAFNLALEKVPAGVPVVVDDCRFPNEAAAISANGGVIVRIERPEVTRSGYQHSSETHALPAARTLHNTASAAALCQQVDELVRDWSWRAA